MTCISLICDFKEIFTFNSWLINPLSYQKLGTKINGLSFVGTRINVNKEHIDPVKETAVNWVALMPYGYMNSAQDSSIKFDLFLAVVWRDKKWALIKRFLFL